MARPAIDVASLTLDERLELIGELWDSLEGLPPSLSAEQSEELAQRIARRHKDGASGTTIELLRKRLLGS